MRCAVFMERDGILNKEVVHNLTLRPPCSMGEFELIKESIPPLLRLRERGLLLIATTNQPGVINGDLSRSELDFMDRLLLKRAPLDDIFVCPHEPDDGCPCHKPEAGLLREAAHKWQIDLDHSFVVSKCWQDAEMARLAGCTSVIIRSPWMGTGHHDFLVDDLQEAADLILQLDISNHTPHTLEEHFRK